MAFTNGGKDNMFNDFLSKSNRVNNTKKPASIHPCDYDEAIENTIELCKYLSKENENNHTSTNLTFDIPGGRRSTREMENVSMIEPLFETINKRNGVILLSSIVKWINDIVRIKIGHKRGIYYSIPIQRNMIMCTLTGNSMHGSNPHYNYFSIARFRYPIDDSGKAIEILDKITKLFSNMIVSTLISENYVYIMSKLQKTTLDKLEKIITVDHEMRTHAVSMGVLFNETIMMNYKDMFKNNYYDINKFNDVTEYIKSVKHVYNSLEKGENVKNLITVEDYFNSYIGANTLIMLDLHQKPSEILDLMKYLSGINFSELSNIRKLLIDKLAMMRKTNLDVFLIDKLLKFCERNIGIQSHCKPSKILMSTTGILPSSFNVTGIFSSFWHDDLYTSSINFYYSEAQLIFQARPKKLYNEQYMAKASLKVLENNRKYDQEELQKNGTCSEGRIYGTFNFDSSFNYSVDAVFYAQTLMNLNYRKFATSHKLKIAGKLQEIGISNVSMRGSCKLEENMKPGIGKSQTSLYSCLEYLEPIITSGNTNASRLIELVKRSRHRTQAYNMSSKEQRGGGRPIGSPDFPTKQELYLVESVYKILSLVQNENLLVKGVNRSAKIAAINRTLISRAYSVKYKEVRHIVMDQSQFSEGDNVNKFCDFIRFNDNIPSRLKRIMIECERKHMSRHQYWPLLPLDAEVNYPNMILPLNGTVGRAGWVQGMKNIISTYAHIAAVTWIVEVFNKYYFSLEENKGLYGEHVGLIYEQIVNSDDSYIIVAFKNVKPIHDFYAFMISAKRLFRLEQNFKKSYITGTIGEIIQKYVANGTIVNIWAKQAVSAFRNNMGVDMSRDISNSISSLGSLLREGAPETMCTYLRAELKNQIYRLYNIGSGKFNDMTTIGIKNYNLPCEMGGWPTQVTTYELCVAGLQAQLDYCKHYYKHNPESTEFKVVSTSIQLNMLRFTDSNLWHEIKRRYKIKNINDITSELDEVDISGVDLTHTDPIRGACKLLYYMISLDNEYVRKKKEDQHVRKIMINGKDEDTFSSANEFNISNEGLSSYDSSFARSTINCINWIINVPKRITRTLEMINKFKHLKPSGLAGLYQERMCIQTAVADLIDQSNSMIIKLSEMNYTKSTRQKASSNAFAATQRCCMISGVPYRMSILGTYYVLLGLNSLLLSVFNQKISPSFVHRVLSDPTSRANIAREIVQNYEKELTVESDGYIANKLPRSEDDITLNNDIQSVLVEMVRPGYMKSQGYIIRYEARLNADIETIRKIYKDWLDISKDMVNTVRTIYFHYISVRRSRYMIAPALDTKNMNDALLSIYEKCQCISTKNIGVYRRTKTEMPSVKRTEETRLMIDNLMGSLEIVLYLSRNYNMTFEEIMSSISILADDAHIKLDNFILENSGFGVFYNLATPYEKKYLALLAHYAGDSSFLTDATKHNEFNIEWEREQDSIINPEGYKIYTGPFRVLISKGNDTVCIDGEPGDIKCIYTTTYNIRFIEDALFYFIRKVPFDGYNRPTEKIKWSNTPFWNSRNTDSSLKLMYTIYGDTKIEKNDKQVITYKKRAAISTDSLKKTIQVSLDADTKYVTYLPLEYNHNLNGSTKKGISYTRFKISNNKVYGLVYKTDNRERTDPITGKKYIKGEFAVESDFLFSYKDAHKSSSYSLLHFSKIFVDGIKLESLSKYGMLKNLLLSELIKTPRAQIMNFMLNEVSPSFLFVEFVKRLIGCITGTTLPSNLDTTSSLATEYIGIDIGGSSADQMKAFNDLSEENDMFDAEEDDDDLYGGVNFGNDLSKSVTSVLVELSMITIDVSKAKLLINCFVNSKIFTEITELCVMLFNATRVPTLDEDWSEMVENINLTEVIGSIESTIYNRFGQLLEVHKTDDNSNIKDEMNTLLSCVLQSGLLSKTTWTIKSILTRANELSADINRKAMPKKILYKRSDSINQYYESTLITKYLDYLYKNRLSKYNIDDAPGDDDFISGSGSNGRRLSTRSSSSLVSGKTDNDSLDIWIK
uniref:RNA-dependent RNA polymerase n=1 Tax=Hubei bunya-like virus 10 TaxID=1922843 RepID=A0A1L3KPG7_9VIRU|nr:RNA-dependent RNA polymerase [Hubei bunya-like virus 10]